MKTVNIALRSLVIVAWLGAFALAQAPLTTIQDTLYDADGSKSNGNIIVSWPTFTSSSVTVPAGQRTYAVSNGAVFIALTPYSGYQVSIISRGATTQSYWSVPASAIPVTISQITVSYAPGPNTSVSLSQLTSGGASSGQCLVYSLSGWVPNSCAGTASVVSVFGRTGAVTAQTGDYAAAQVTNAAATNASNTWTAGTQDMSSAAGYLPPKYATASALPATCTVGQVAFVTAALAGQQLYECSSANTWTQQVAGGGAPYYYSSVMPGTVTATGSTTTLFSVSNAPALAAGACYEMSVEVQVPAGHTWYLYVDGVSIGQVWSGGSPGEYDQMNFSYCNQTGTQSAQAVFGHWQAYSSSGPGWQTYTVLGTNESPTAVNWSTSHTVAIVLSSSSGQVFTPLLFRIRM